MPSIGRAAKQLNSLTMPSRSSPMLQLSLGGVDFVLHPASDEKDGTVTFQQQDKDHVLLNLKSFTGSLCVRMSSSSVRATSPMEAALKVQESKPSDVTPQPGQLSVGVASAVSHTPLARSHRETTALASSPVDETMEDVSSSHKRNREVFSPMPSKRAREMEDEEESEKQEPVVEEETEDPTIQMTAASQSQPTLLGQPDFSQTQQDSSSTRDSFPVFDVATPPDQQQTGNSETPPSTVKRIMDALSCSPLRDPQSDSEDSPSKAATPNSLIFQEEEKQEEEKQKEPSEQQATSFVKAIQQESPEKQVASPVKTVQSPPIAPSSEPPPLRARVSLGASPLAAAPKRQDPPCPRWGHTMTAIGQDRLLIYGGQSFDAETGLPKTLNDVYLYDVAEKKWTKPCNCDGMPRQWHTATYVPERELLISFGGEAAHPKTGKVKTTDTVMVLDTEILLWYPPTVSGTVPSGRSGHTATLLGSDLVVLGGVKGSKWLNWQAASVLHTGSWTWTAPKVQGSAPKPRSYHSAVAVGSRVVVFGGNNADHSFNTVHVLEKREKEGVETWHWTHPKTKGAVPKARTGHSAVLLSDQKTICIYGGWDPNAEDDKDEDIIFQDCLYLDTDKWMWFQDAKQKVTPLTSEDGGPKRVGHTAVATEDGSQVLVFGGRIPGDRFTGDFQTLSVPKQLKK